MLQKLELFLKAFSKKRDKMVSVSRSRVAINVISVEGLWTKHLKDGAHLFLSLALSLLLPKKLPIYRWDYRKNKISFSIVTSPFGI